METQKEIVIFGKKIIVDYIPLDKLIERKDMVHKYAITENPDSSHEDLMRTRWCQNAIANGWTILRVEYFLNKCEHGYGKGDILALSPTFRFCAIEFKSLCDLYSKSENEKIRKMEEQSKYYAQVANSIYNIECYPIGILQKKDHTIGEYDFTKSQPANIVPNDILTQSNTKVEKIGEDYVFTRTFNMGFGTSNRKSFRNVVQKYCEMNNIPKDRVKLHCLVGNEVKLITF